MRMSVVITGQNDGNQIMFTSYHQWVLLITYLKMAKVQRDLYDCQRRSIGQMWIKFEGILFRSNKASGMKK